MSTLIFKPTALASLQVSDKPYYKNFLKVKEGNPKPVQKPLTTFVLNSPIFHPEISKMNFPIRRQEVTRNHTEMANKISNL